MTSSNKLTTSFVSCSRRVVSVYVFWMRVRKSCCSPRASDFIASSLELFSAIALRSPKISCSLRSHSRRVLPSTSITGLLRVHDAWCRTLEFVPHPVRPCMLRLVTVTFTRFSHRVADAGPLRDALVPHVAFSTLAFTLAESDSSFFSFFSTRVDHM